MLDGCGPFENVARAAVQSAAQLIQNVGSIHAGSIVVEPEQSRVGHTTLLSQAIDRPTLPVKDFSELANDHVDNLAGPMAACKINHIYKV